MKARIQYLSVLRVIACLAVVVLHTFYAADMYAGEMPGIHHALLSVRSCMMWAVPCFVMVSGVLLLDKTRQITYQKIFSRYILRMGLALVIFTLLFSLYDHVCFPREGQRLGIGAALLEGVRAIFTNGSWSHMWYLYMMIALYLMLPLYRRIVRGMGRRDMLYLLGLLLVFQSLRPLVNTFFPEHEIYFYIFTSTAYPLYLFLGYAIHRRMLRIPFSIALALTTLSGFGLVLLNTIGADAAHPAMTLLSTNYSSPLILLFSLGVFSMGYALHDRKLPEGLWKCIQQIDGCTFGVYLLHMAALKLVLVSLGFNPLTHGGIGMVCLISLGVFVGTVCITWVLRRIPFVNRVL